MDPVLAEPPEPLPAVPQAFARVGLEALFHDYCRHVEALGTSDGYLRYLEFQRRFWNYSFGNTVLIACQNPTATWVAGVRTWNKMGRHVQKGEHGLKILAPITTRVVDRTQPDEPGPERVVAFRLASVFDLSQTEGDPVPEPVRPHPLRGEAPEGLLRALVRFAADRGLTVQTDVPATAMHSVGVKGDYDPSRQRIRLVAGIEPAQQAKTLAHELGHALLHPAGYQGTPRAVAEVEAESVAYLVCAHLGLPTSAYTFPYVLGWAGGTGAEAVAKIQDATTRITTAAKTLIQALTPPTLGRPELTKSLDAPTRPARPGWSRAPIQV